MLKPETQSAVNQALNDRDSALAADADHDAAVEALAQATADEADALQVALDAMRVAHDSGHAALVALAAELGVQLI